MLWVKSTIWASGIRFKMLPLSKPTYMLSDPKSLMRVIGVTNAKVRKLLLSSTCMKPFFRSKVST